MPVSNPPFIGTPAEPIRVDPVGTTTQPVSAVTLPLPAGAATQTTLADIDAIINASLNTTLSSRASEATLATRVADATITARLGVLGQGTMAGSTPVVIASNQSALPVTATVSGTVDVSDRVGRLVGHVTVDSSVLPTGAATEATLATRLSDATLTARLAVLGQGTMAGSAPVVIASNQTAIPISVASLPLPAGAATEATLATRVADATITARLGVLGQATMAASAPVVISSNQSAIPISAASLPLPTGAATEATLATRLADATLTARLAVLGQGTMAASAPVVIASNQSAIPISAASLPLPTGAATEATLATRVADATITARLGVLGQAVMASSTPVVIASNQSAIPISAAALPLPAGAATEATLATRLADATFTARINTLGQKAMAASTPVVLASDQSAIPITAAALPLPTGAATEATLATRAAAVQLPAALVGGRLDVVVGAALPASTNRIGRVEFNAPTTALLTSASINAAANGDNTLVAAVVGQTTRVFRLFFVVAQAVNVTFKDGATGLTGAMSLAKGGSFTLDFDAEPWFVTAANSAFILNLSSAVQVSGRVYYTTS